MAKVDRVDYSADFGNLYSKMNDLNTFFRTGKLSYNMLRYIPSLANVCSEGQLHSTEIKRKYVVDAYNNKKVLEFIVQLRKGHYTNFQNVHFCLPLKSRMAADNDNDLTAGVITVNKFFADWIKEIHIKRFSYFKTN